MLKNFKELQVWQKSYLLSLEIYKLSANFPAIEKFGLISQLRRAAISIPSNIAEGYGRKTTGEYIYSLYIAYGSLCELETQILISLDLNYLDKMMYEGLNKRLIEVSKMLRGLIKSLENKVKITKN